MVMPLQSLPGLRITGNTLVKKGNGTLAKVIPSAASTGTLTVYDGISSAGTLLVNAMPLTAGTPVAFDLAFQVGLYIVLGGTVDVLVTYY